MDHGLEDLKKHWKNLSSADGIDRLGIEAPTVSVGSKSIGNRRKLLRFYRVLTVISVLYIILAPGMLFPMGIFPTWALALLSIFFAAAAAMNIYMYSLIKAVNFSEMSTLDLLERVRTIYKVHIRQTIAGILIVIPILSMMLWYFYSDPSIFLGGVCGALVGALIGWRNNLRVIRYLREIESELASAYN